MNSETKQIKIRCGEACLRVSNLLRAEKINCPGRLPSFFTRNIYQTNCTKTVRKTDSWYAKHRFVSKREGVLLRSLQSNLQVYIRKWNNDLCRLPSAVASTRLILTFRIKVAIRWQSNKTINKIILILLDRR